jgi:hypothetical protein
MWAAPSHRLGSWMEQIPRLMPKLMKRKIQYCRNCGIQPKVYLKRNLSYYMLVLEGNKRFKSIFLASTSWNYKKKCKPYPRQGK